MPTTPETPSATVLVHFENGVMAILPALTECWDALGPAPVRALFQLPPHEREWSGTLAGVQQETVRVGVCIRSQPGFRGCGYESAKVESKDERIARLEASLARQTTIAETLAAAVQKAQRTTSDMVPLRKPPVPLLYQEKRVSPLDPVGPYVPRHVKQEHP